MMDIQAILKVLPHRFPFLLVDRVIECEPGKRLVALKNVTYNEMQFLGHFPGDPVMPGVLVIEALAQACVLLASRSGNAFDPERHVVFFLGMDAVRFRRVVRPGDQLRLEVEALRAGSKVWKLRGVAKVGDDVAAEGELLASFAARPA